jgi:hypothetical protein
MFGGQGGYGGYYPQLGFGGYGGYYPQLGFGGYQQKIQPQMDLNSIPWEQLLNQASQMQLYGTQPMINNPNDPNSGYNPYFGGPQDLGGMDWAYQQQPQPQVTSSTLGQAPMSGGMPSVMPQNSFQFGQNFGKKLFNQGTLGQKGKQQIKQAGYTGLKDFATQNPNFRQDYAAKQAKPEANTMMASNPGRRNTPAVFGQPAQTDFQRQNPAYVAAGIGADGQSVSKNTMTQSGEMGAANPGRRYR